MIKFIKKENKCNKTNNRGTQKSGQQITNDDVQGLTPEKWRWLIIC